MQKIYFMRYQVFVDINVFSIIITISMAVVPFIVLYYVIKIAVKNAIIEAHRKMNNKNLDG